MAKNEFGIGKPVRRKEDRRLLTGRGRYTVDIDIPRQAHAVLLRSPHAHARIASIDSQHARCRAFWQSMPAPTYSRQK
jgi:aerobic carbon-monoxide dehydrogenase large subunit